MKLTMSRVLVSVFVVGLMALSGCTDDDNPFCDTELRICIDSSCGDVDVDIWVDGDYWGTTASPSCIENDVPSGALDYLAESSDGGVWGYSVFAEACQLSELTLTCDKSAHGTDAETIYQSSN